MDENKKISEGPLSEKELDEISGGVLVSPPYEKPANTKCWFERDKSQEPRGDEDGIHVWWKCSANCWKPCEYCICHGKDVCVGKWHKFHANGGHA